MYPQSALGSPPATHGLEFWYLTCRLQCHDDGVEESTFRYEVVADETKGTDTILVH